MNKKEPFRVMLTIRFPDGKTYETITTLVEAIQLEQAGEVVIIAVKVYDGHS